MGQGEVGTAAPGKPFVAGVLGAADPVVLDRLTQHAPAPVARLVDRPPVVLLASPGVEPWAQGDERGWCWGRVPLTGAPRRWQDAARDLVAAGVASGPDGWRLHADAVALHDVFLRELGDAVYFATTMAPLMALTDEPLHPDWAGWSTCLFLGGPIGAQTTVREIRRLGAGEVLHLGRDGALTHERDQPFWERLPDAPVTPGRVADLLIDGVPDGDDLLDLPLSGGWDSRAIALAAHRKGRRLRTWTTYQHRPFDLDVEYAAAVAEALGSHHRTFLPERRAWQRRLTRVWERTEHQTWMHGWFEDFAHLLRKRGRPVMDGLFGETSFRADVAVRGAADPRPWAPVMFELLGARRDHWVAPELAGAVADTAYAAFEDLTSPLEGHPNVRTAAHLLSRSRAIGSASRLLLGPELRVHVPFAHPEVMTAALGIPLADKADGAFYRRLLTELDPEIGRFPSTNDHAPRKVTPAYARPHLRALCETIQASDLALRMLTPALREVLARPDRTTELQRGTRATSILSWAAVLADFEQTHGSRLDWSGWPC